MIYSHRFAESSMLADCQYDDESHELTIMFLNGRTYTYKNVLYNTYEDLANAKSSGKYFNSIKSQLVLK